MLHMRFYLIKIKDLYMTALEKRGSVVITEMEILAHMGLIHMNSSMHSLVVLTSLLGIVWALGDFIIVQKQRAIGHLISAIISSFLLKNPSSESNVKSMFFAMKHVAPAMELELNVAMTLQNAPDAEVKAG